MSESRQMSRNRVHPSPVKRHTTSAVLNSIACLPPSTWKDDVACRRFIINYLKKSDGTATNAFGEVEFGSGGGRTAKFVRVRENTDVRILYQLLTKHWKLKTPNLIISVTGGAKNFTLRPRIKEVFRKSLIKASEYTGAWITTGGTHAGVMKHVGKAVKNYAAIRDDKDKVVTIGIATWGVVYGRENLVNPEDKAMGNLFPKHYDPDEKDQGKLAVLDYNHSHFILVDDGTDGEYGKEIELRTKLEKHIATQQTEDKVNVMIVCVILQGGPGSLKTVHESIMQKTPAVVVEGSGGFADILASASTMEPQKITKQVMKELLRDFNFDEPEDEQLQDWTKRVKECVMHKKLLSVFKLDPTDTSKDLDIAILEALLKANDDVETQASQQLKLALAWNRSDIARSHILTDDTRISKREIADCFFEALKSNKADFCKVLLDYGVDVKKHCKVAVLEHLYRTIPKDTVLYRKLSKHRKDDNFTLVDVGKAMLDFLGQSYITIYKKRREGSKKYHAISGEFVSEKNWQDTDIAKAGIHNPEGATLDDPYREIFQWALLSDRKKIARYVWEFMWESLPAAVVATRILKILASKSSDYESKVELLAEADEYEKLAVAVLGKCFDDNADKTTPLLIRSLKKWGGYTCLHVAIEANDKLFVSRPAVQYFFDKVWMGKLDDNTSTFAILLAGICPPLIWMIVPFKSYTEEEDIECLSESEAYADGTTDIEMARLPNNHAEAISSTTTEPWVINNPVLEMSPSRKSYSCLDKLLMFYDAPVVTFWMNVISFLVYLVLFASIILSNFTEVISIVEWIVLGWISTFLVEEIREIADEEARYVKEKIYIHSTDLWNIMDMASLALLYIGFGLRWNASMLEAALILYCLSFMIQCVRIVHIFAVHHVLGPKIIMVGKMVKDLMFFLFILVVFLLAYGVASQALLYPNESNFGDIIVGIIYKPYWQIYGELFLEEINYNANVGEYTCSDDATAGLPRCPRTTAAVPILSAVYLLFVNVLLLNLLIAMFSYTFDKVERQGNEIWKFQRYSLITDYYFRPPLVPPFIVLSHVFLFIRFVKRKIFSGLQRDDPFSHALKMDLDSDEQKQLNNWEHWHAGAYLWDKRAEDNSKTENQLQKLNDRIDNLMSTVENLQDAMKGHAGHQKGIKRLNSLMVERFTNIEALLEANQGVKHAQQVMTKPTPAPQPAQSKKPAEPKRSPKPGPKSPSNEPRKDPAVDMHIKSRSSPYPGSNVNRSAVPDDKVSWKVDWPEYTPVHYTAEVVKNLPPWADVMLETLGESERPRLPYNQQDLTNKVNRASHMGVYDVVDGFPRNPSGRTGLTGRGVLGRYGPNHAADPVVTRWKRDGNKEVVKIDGKPVLEFVAIKRVDTGEWAIPGGMVDPGEKVSATLKREFSEEAVNVADSGESRKGIVKENLRLLFKSGGLEVYKGYCDDHRNTDVAWIETVAANFHDEAGTVFEHIPLHPGDEAQKACWKTLRHDLSLFASHTTILKKAAEMHNAYF